MIMSRDWLARVGAAALTFGAALGPGGAADAADIDAGLALAERWCNSCHSIGAEEPRQEDAGPIWTEIADKDEDALRAALDAPHDFMPEFPSLSDEDKANLVAYIRSLK